MSFTPCSTSTNPTGWKLSNVQAKFLAAEHILALAKLKRVVTRGCGQVQVVRRQRLRYTRP